MNNGINGIGNLNKKTIKSGEVIGIVSGILFFGLSIYTLHLSLKVNRLTLKKLNDEGYK